MKILKPNWVHHDDYPIFSVDVHPDCSRFATGGQGQDSGRVVIWNMGPIIDFKQENDPGIPKILCQMDHHIGSACVNVVRWSNNGLFLASGSDDKLIMIWHFVNGGGYQNIENWKCGYTLRAHNGDVLDLAWSPKDQFLASCSVDNTIIIWNALKFPDIITRINAHNGFVKGVAWDPIGTFFASQSDDKTLKIWKTLDWSLEKSIEEPFKDCTGTTHVLRLNWSPDGQFLISAHAINNSVPTAQIIDRNNKWSTKLDFVGHRKAVTAVRFFPLIMKEEETKCKKVYCVCALGSRDRSISVWQTKVSRPLCVLHDLFDNPVIDLSWSKRPKPALLACSMDGTVAYLEFDYNEIGYPLNKQETEEFFMSKYNYDVNATISIKDTNVPQFSAAKEPKDSLKFIENYDILLAQEKKQAEILEKKQQPTTPAPTPTTSKSTQIDNKQIERRLPDGRRRITPICVSKPGEYDAPRPFAANQVQQQLDKQGFTSSIGFEASNSSSKPEMAAFQSTSSSTFVSKTATEQSTIIVEKRDEKDRVVEVSPIKSVIYSKAGLFNQNSNSSDFLMKTVNKNTPTLSSVSNETKTPVVAANGHETKPSRPPTPANETKPQQKVAPTSNVPSKPAPAASKPNEIRTQSQPSKSSKTSSKPNEPPKPASTATSAANPVKQTPKPQTKPPTSTATVAQTTSSEPETISPTKKRPFSNVDVHSETRYLAPLRIDGTSSSRIYKIEDKKVTLVITNWDAQSEKQANTSMSEDTDCRVSLLKLFENEKTPKWQTFFLSRICEATCNKYVVVCACEDATISVIKLNQGTHICCPIVLDSRAAVLHSALSYFMCVTVGGNVYVWRYESAEEPRGGFLADSRCEAGNFFNLTAVISQLSCQFLLRDRALNKAFVTDSGVPVIQMSGNKSYFYSAQTKSWHLVPISGIMNGPGSEIFKTNVNGSGSSEPTQMPLDEIQSRQLSSNIVKTIETLNKSMSSRELLGQHDFTTVYLESQINAAAGLNSPKEYKFWLLTYARYLIENGKQEKLNELCYFLLGPLYSMNWNETIMVFKKRDLLKEILPIIAQNVALQRIYVFFKKQLSALDSMNQKSSTSVLDRMRTGSNKSSIQNSQARNETSLREAQSQDSVMEKEQDGEVGKPIEMVAETKTDAEMDVDSDKQVREENVSSAESKLEPEMSTTTSQDADRV